MIAGRFSDNYLADGNFENTDLVFCTVAILAKQREFQNLVCRTCLNRGPAHIDAAFVAVVDSRTGDSSERVEIQADICNFKFITGLV